MKTKLTKIIFITLFSLNLTGCGTSSTSHQSSTPSLQTPISLDEELNNNTNPIDDTNLTSNQYCSSVPVTEVLASSDVLLDSQKLSAGIVKTSEKLLSLSDSLLDAGSSSNDEYIDAMLILSDDIGTMADRILLMADKILVMADDIGEMSDRILETQRIQSDNVKLTQSNIVASQNNLNKAKK